MSGDADFELRRLHVVYVNTPDDGKQQAFAIDGRDYTDADEMQRDLDDAWEELRQRRIIAEFETRSIEGQARLTWLPTWKQYKATAFRAGGA
jgi:hypothetical protein